MQHHTQNNMQNGNTSSQITAQELLKINGGKSTPATLSESPLQAVKQPIYITLAIGEDGGRLPDLLS